MGSVLYIKLWFKVGALWPITRKHEFSKARVFVQNSLGCSSENYKKVVTA